MRGTGVSEVVARLAQPDPPGVERVAALLGTTLERSEENPDWTFYRFALSDGPFAGGVLRLSTAGDAALLSLSPRDPPGITETQVDTSAWGQRSDAVPMPRLSSEGADLLKYQLDGVTLSTFWTHTSRRLLNLALEWPAPEPLADDEPA